ncbi:hypothetical protein Mgra_00005258 [Meloidogyne graminicola]|uniref:Uncharacterized protein n=1 Tax=Meloidogyne graminicola TaxID=189291 RepID=A0A8S9ZPF4_9BILA|nr:hypothetical protein Mgra_00005258 [Meloidogyne graminicola]
MMKATRNVLERKIIIVVELYGRDVFNNEFILIGSSKDSFFGLSLDYNSELLNTMYDIIFGL